MQRVNGYEVKELLGRGATAEVFRADLNGKGFAIKKFYPNLVQDVSLFQRFQKEFRLARDLVHPNIVGVQELINEPPCVVMELVDGESFEQLQKRLPFVYPELSLLLIRPVLKALAFAHERNVIHRDIKPSNILLSKTGQVYLADFGLARLEGESKLTLTGSVLGSPDFMAPEQARGENMGPSSDLFSLASVLYFLVTGTRPFSRSTPLATLSAVSQVQYESAQRRNPKISSGFNALFEKAFQLDVSKRFSTANEFLLAVDGYLDGVGLLESAKQEKDYVGRWLLAPNDFTLEALNQMSASLEQRSRKALSDLRVSDASSALSHLSMISPESSAIMHIAQNLKKAKRKKELRRYVPALLLLLLFLAGSGLLIKSQKQISAKDQSSVSSQEESLVEEHVEVKVAAPPQIKQVPKTVVAKEKPAKVEKFSSVQVNRPKRKVFGSRVRFNVADQVDVYWEGRLLPKGAVLERVKKGAYQLELRRKGFPPIKETVEVDGKDPVTIRAR
ncbi:serine/threonine protein kinase [bacterium]|nr:serine/threonine protein kinase [bacterium]